MKRSVSLRIFLCLCLFLFVSQAYAANLPSLSFQAAGLESGQKLAVYSAPSASSWRGASGKASVSTNGSVYYAGWDGDWMLVLYEISNGKLRAGYVDGRQLQGRTPEKTQLAFASATVVTVKKTVMTDDPNKASSNMTTLKKGTSVTFLARFGDWAYIETVIKKKAARGFVKLEDLALDEVVALYAAMPDEHPDGTPTPEADTNADEPDQSATTDDPAMPEPGDAPSQPDSTTPAQPQSGETPGADTATSPDSPSAADGPAADDPAAPDQQSAQPSASDSDDSGTGTADSTAPDTGSADGDAYVPGQPDAPPSQPDTQPESWSEDGVIYTRDTVSPRDVPSEAAPKHGPSDAGESAVSDAGADWYGLAYYLYDDNIRCYVYATDSRGYLANPDSGYVDAVSLNTGGYGSDRTARLYELPNGDLLVEYYESTSTDKYGFPVVLGSWCLLRPTGTGFALLMTADYLSSIPRAVFTDFRSGIRLTADLSGAFDDGLAAPSTYWLVSHLNSFFADWGLVFEKGNTLEFHLNRRWGTGTLISAALNSSGCTLALTAPDANHLPKIEALEDEAKAHYLPPERADEDILSVLAREMADVAVPLTQVSVFTRDDLLYTEFTTPDRLSITFVQESSTGTVTQVILNDTKLYTFRLCKSAKDLGKLETTFAMRRAWYALTSCPSLGLTDADGMAAFDLQWDQTETTPGQFYVFAQHTAGNASAELRRTYQRAGAESITSRLILTID